MYELVATQIPFISYVTFSQTCPTYKIDVERRCEIIEEVNVKVVQDFRYPSNYSWLRSIVVGTVEEATEVRVNRLHNIEVGLLFNTCFTIKFMFDFSLFPYIKLIVFFKKSIYFLF